MASVKCPDVVVYVCNNCVPQGGHLPRQWKQGPLQVLLREVPCSGKMDLQYLLRALEGGVCGLCVVACPRGQCHLAQGNYRAEVRLGTLRRLLAEIGLEPERVALVHGSLDDSPEHLRQLVDAAVARIATLGRSPMGRDGGEESDAPDERSARDCCTSPLSSARRPG